MFLLPFLKKYKFVLLISLFLFIIPFFWLKPGEMDLGGDSGRLYFYDPQYILKSVALYSIIPFGIGQAEAFFVNLPFLIIISAIKFFIPSPYILISLMNDLKLIVSFLVMFAIIKELIEMKKQHKIPRELAAIIGGLFYISSPMFIGNFDRALANHNQVFLNPLMFFLILRFFLTKNIMYILVLLMISFIFSENFSWASAPPLFAFYPLAALFLALHVKFIRKKKLPWKESTLALVIFFGLHAFHLIPTITSLFEQGSSINNLVSTGITSQLDVFYGYLSIAKVSVNVLSYSELKQFGVLSIIIPFIVIFGLLLNKNKQKTILLTGIFFLIVFYLITAKISQTGVEFYSRLYYIPSFYMFRNFIGQWQFVFYFFYALLFGQALFFILSKLSRKYMFVLSFIIVIILTVNAWPFINGSLVNKVHFQSKGVKFAITMDPKYEEALSYVKSLPDDAKILTLPFTDCCYQVIHGINNGAYVGVSTIGFLGGKKDFSGYNIIVPFSDLFVKLAKEKDYGSIKRMLSLLNVRYIFYNSDPMIYDTTFPSYPYDHVRKYFPNDQKGYGEFVGSLTDEKIFERGSYGVYTVDKTVYLPHFYIPTEVIPYENTVNDWYGKTVSFFVNENDNNKNARLMHVEREICKSILSGKACSQKIAYNASKIPKMQFEKVNPTKYKINIFGATESYMLVFSEAFNANWKVFFTNSRSKKSTSIKTYFNESVEEGKHKNIFLDDKTFETLGMKSLAENHHILVNAYANAWYITPKDSGERKDYELIIEMVGQRKMYFSLIVSFFTFVACIIWGTWLLLKSRNQ